MNLVKKSKYLSLLLRHAPQKANLNIDKAGWVDVNQLVSNTDFTLNILEDIVTACDKQRYEFSLDKSKIRARQGHSIPVDLGYQSSIPPDVLYHGTAVRFLTSIKNQGLKSMNRHHVHLSQDKSTATKVGARHGKVVILTVDSRAMSQDGHQFYVTDNNVWLTDLVPVKYITFK